MSTPKSLIRDLMKENGLVENDIKQQMKEEHCHEIAMQVGQDWEILATFIGISDIDVDDIKQRYQEPQKRRLALLIKWNKMYGSEATYAKMAHGLEKIGNRQLIECLIGLLKSDIQTQRESCDMHQQTSRNVTFKVHLDCNCYIMSLLISAYLALIIGTFYCVLIDATTHFSTMSPHLKCSTMVQIWSETPNFHNSTNCSHPVGHDLPVLHSPFIGREDDIKNIIRKALKANILNINGAPAFGKSTVAIHTGYRLVEDCVSVRYVNIEELSWKTLSEFMGKSSKSTYNKTQGRRGNKHSSIKQTAAVTTFANSLETKEDLTDSKSSTVASGNYIEELKQWSMVIKHTTVLILDNADLVLANSFRKNFIDLISLLVYNSNFHLHIIVVSQEKLLLLENFDRWIVRQLSQEASVELLNELAPSIADGQLNKIAELLQGCPLALKVIGNILNVYGQGIINELENELENELQQEPIAVLDQVSDKRQRFSAMMDLILSKLEFLRKCGYMISLFPGSFSREAGITILPSKECLEIFEKQSLLDEYFLAHQHRYKMHRLINEYLKEKINNSDKVTFENRFCKYYTQFLLNYAMESELNNIDERLLSSENKNIDLLEELLMSSAQRNFSIEELAALAFLVSEDYIKLQSSFKLYLKTLNPISKLVSPGRCGRLISHIVKHFHLRCKCETVTDYIQTFFNYPCTDIFDCELITELFRMHSFLDLSELEEVFLHNIRTYKCLSFSYQEIYSWTSRYLIISLFITSFLLFLALLLYFNILDSIIVFESLVARLISVILFLMITVYFLDVLLIIKVGIKLLCYTPSILLAIFIFTCYKFHPFHVNLHLQCNTTALVLSFSALILLVFFLFINVHSYQYVTS